MTIKVGINGFGRIGRMVLRSLIENSRKEIAGLLNVSSSEIIFTSGGTEGDNMILRNCVKNLGIKHIVSSKIEHHAVTHTLDYLSTLDNLKISYVKTHNNGDIDYTDHQPRSERHHPTLPGLGRSNRARTSGDNARTLLSTYHHEHLATSSRV